MRFNNKNYLVNCLYYYYNYTEVRIGLHLITLCFVFLMVRQPPSSTRTYTLFPYTTLFRACKVLDFPIVSGNVSLYNETKNEDGTGSAILPTPAIGGIGLLQDIETSATIAFKDEGEAIFVIGQATDGSLGHHLGHSLWLRELHGREDGPPTRPEERRVGKE